jgi:hypothetical protein
MKMFLFQKTFKSVLFGYLFFRLTLTTFAATTDLGNNGDGRLMNPLKATDIITFLMGILDVLLTFALPIIIFFIMYGGFKLVTARGQAEQISEGRAAITWAVIGGVIVLGAKIIIEVIKGTVAALSA